MTHRLFVYGTLAPGRPNEHVLANLPGEWEPATVNGRLLQAGWGAPSQETACRHSGQQASRKFAKRTDADIQEPR